MPMTDLTEDERHALQLVYSAQQSVEFADKMRSDAFSNGFRAGLTHEQMMGSVKRAKAKTNA